MEGFYAENKISRIDLWIDDDLFMVLAMEFYDTGLRMGQMTNTGFLAAFQEMIFMLPICFVMGFCIVDRIAPKVAYSMATPGKDSPILVTTVRAGVTVAMMCPIMSFWATVIFQRPGVEFLGTWFQTIVINFPMAFFWQFFSAAHWCAYCFGHCSVPSFVRPNRKGQSDSSRGLLTGREESSTHAGRNPHLRALRTDFRLDHTAQ